MVNNDPFIFGVCALIVFMCVLAFGVYKCGQLKDEIKKTLRK